VARFDQQVRYDSTARYDQPPSPPLPTKYKHMAKVKLDLDNKNGQEILVASSGHIAAMASPEGLALFVTPEPTVANYLVVHNALSTGLNLITTLEGQLAAARAALPGLMAALKVEMQERAVYVEAETDGDPALIPISGFAVAGTAGTPIGPLPRPENVKAVMGPFPGMVKLSCDPVKGTQMYVMDCRLIDPPGGPFQQAKLSTKSRNDLTGLISGKMYAFRMAVIGAAGQSPWSDEAQCMAP
jgi:hypothetical protein